MCSQSLSGEYQPLGYTLNTPCLSWVRLDPLVCGILLASLCCSKNGPDAVSRSMSKDIVLPSNVEPGSFSAAILKCNQLASNWVLRTYAVSNLFVRKARCNPVQVGHSAAPCFTVLSRQGSQWTAKGGAKNNAAYLLQFYSVDRRCTPHDCLTTCM